MCKTLWEYFHFLKRGASRLVSKSENIPKALAFLHGAEECQCGKRGGGVPIWASVRRNVAEEGQYEQSVRRNVAEEGQYGQVCDVT